ncbi:DeoR family transcriptional regulator, partial [Piscinibacter sp.]|uniref:DeoR family transcriptional regulator n=1 Tax=Piscinibacter sp. TaxID=1903157 RepID=UPI0037849EBE
MDLSPRQLELLEEVRRARSVSVEALAERFGVTLQTVRRDVRLLAEAGLLAIRALGGVNGQALACAETSVAARAKQLMLAHAPKTQRFGAAYE